MWKNLLCLLIILFCSSPNSFAQYCGGSIRRISLDFEKNAKKPNKIYYNLFYLLPKRTDRYLNYSPNYETFFQEITVFLAEFLTEKPENSKTLFWVGNWVAEEKFTTVSHEKAQKYLDNYKLKNFEGRWTENHLSQLQGKSCDGILEWQTTETDYTPFLLEIKAEKFETLYFVSNFLGGCFLKNDQPVVQQIKMKSIKKEQ